MVHTRSKFSPLVDYTWLEEQRNTEWITVRMCWEVTSSILVKRFSGQVSSTNHSHMALAISQSYGLGMDHSSCFFGFYFDFLLWFWLSLLFNNSSLYGNYHQYFAHTKYHIFVSESIQSCVKLKDSKIVFFSVKHNNIYLFHFIMTTSSTETKNYFTFF